MWSATATVGVIGGMQSDLALEALDGGDDDRWQLRGSSVQASVHGVREWVRLPEFEAQACLVSGELAGEPVAWPGVRARRAHPGRIDSLRQVLAWFDSQRAVVLDAARPRGPHGHERDHVHAAILRPDLTTAVQEGRLSTTYDGEGRPLRVGLELWLANEQEHPYPHRLAGEVLEGCVEVSADEHDLQLAPLQTHYAGDLGHGVLILARPR